MATMSASLVYTAEGRLNTKQQRQRDLVKDLDMKTLSTIPESYRVNNNKEELCLEYVTNFAQQFSAIYKNRREPFVAAENEYGVKKLVCSTIRPTLIPIPELYDMYECSSFLAGYVLYEPLDPPTEPPKFLFSPARTLDTFCGDCFDISTLLCSFLLGAGYDAFVIMGYAPTFITLKDQSHTVCPLIKDVLESKDSSSEGASNNTQNDESPNMFVPPDNVVKKSKFLADITEKKRLAAIDTFQLWIPDPPLDEVAMMEAERTAHANEQRIHAWVLVRAGTRDVKEHTFIEPSTGRAYLTKTAPYIAVESAWNHLNYYANTRLDVPVHELDYAFETSSLWEPLFLSKEDVLNSAAARGEDDHDLMDHEGPESESKTNYNDDGLRLFDAPARWSQPLALSRHMYLLKFPPHGKRTVQYYCAKADFFSRIPALTGSNGPRSSNNQSMVMRITLYLDAACTIVREIHEWFENRVDHMYKRVRHYLDNHYIIEYYSPGSKGEVKKWLEYPGKKLEVDFYVNGRLDRLLRREEVYGQSIVEIFSQRSDYLIHRLTLLTTERGNANTVRQFILPDGSLTPEIYITRITLQYDNQPGVIDGSDIAKRIFYVREGKAVFYYHFAKGKVTGKVQTFLHTRGPAVPTLSDQAIAQELGLSDDVDAMQEAATLEREAFSSVKASFLLHQKLLDARLDAEMHVTSEKTVFERALDSVDTASNTFSADATVSMNENKSSDYLTPFLRTVADPNHLTKEEALAIRAACLDALKARLVERANIIQTKLHEENAKLGKKQELFQRSQREGDFSTEEYEKYCTEAMFRIQILEQRLSAHEETALRKFAELDLKLSNDPRLKVLKN